MKKTESEFLIPLIQANDGNNNDFHIDSRRLWKKISFMNNSNQYFVMKMIYNFSI